MTQLDAVAQLVNSYYKNEVWHNTLLSIEEAINYHTKLLDKGNIIYYEKDNRILGYVEFWRINKYQLKQVITKKGFCSYSENVWKGNICYVANLWIESEYRKGEVSKWLKQQLFQRNLDCDYFVGEETFNNNRVRIFKRSKLWEKKRQ